jgi:hypothetical protein
MKVTLCFGGKSYLYFQGRRVSQGAWSHRKQEETAKKKTHQLLLTRCLLHAGFLLGLIFDAEDGGDMLFQNFV